MVSGSARTGGSCSRVTGIGGLIACEYHGDLNEVQGDRALAALLSAETARAPFDRLEWFALFAAQCGLLPLLAVVCDGDARGVLPLVGTRGHLRALANWYTFRVVPLATAGADRLALFTTLAGSLKQQSWRLTLEPLADEGGETALLSAAFRAAGWRVRTERCGVNHILDVGGRSFAEYMVARPGQLRTTLKRKGGKVTVTLFDDFDAAAWDDYEAVYRASWKPEEGSPAFLRAFAAAEGAAGRLRMALAHADGVPVAAQFWTVEGGTAFIHKLAHTEAAKALSPGTTLSAALFEQVIDRDRVDRVDFGTGDDAYKRDWMEAVRPRYRLDALNPSNPRSWPHLLLRGLRRLAPGRANG